MFDCFGSIKFIFFELHIRNGCRKVPEAGFIVEFSILGFLLSLHHLDDWIHPVQDSKSQRSMFPTFCSSLKVKSLLKRGCTDGNCEAEWDDVTFEPSAISNRSSHSLLVSHLTKLTSPINHFDLTMHLVSSSVAESWMEIHIIKTLSETSKLTLTATNTFSVTREVRMKR